MQNMNLLMAVINEENKLIIELFSYVFRYAIFWDINDAITIHWDQNRKESRNQNFRQNHDMNQRRHTENCRTLTSANFPDRLWVPLERLYIPNSSKGLTRITSCLSSSQIIDISIQQKLPIIRKLNEELNQAKMLLLIQD